MQLRDDKFNTSQSKIGYVGGKGSDVRLDMKLDFNIKKTNINSSITGKVVDSNNKPIKDAIVKLMDVNLQPLTNAVTDSNGEYSILLIPYSTNYNIVAIARDKILSDISNFSFTSGDNKVFNFILQQDNTNTLGMISGTLLDINSKSIVGAIISLYSLVNGINTFIAFTYTDISGVFVFSELTIGNYNLKITALGYKQNEVNTIVNSGEISKIFEILYINPEVSDGVISGVITDSSNNAIENADVLLYKIDLNNSIMPMAFTRTNSKGIYTFINVSSGNYLIKSNVSQFVSVEDTTQSLLDNSIVTATIPTYNALEGILENGALIQNIDGGQIVGWLGGPKDGAVSIAVNANNTAVYNLGIKYISGEARPFKIDINGINTQTIYTITKTTGYAMSNAKVFTLPVSLNSGKNIIKFHGDGTNYAPSILMLTLIESIPITMPKTISIPTINIYRKTSLSPGSLLERKKFNISFHTLEPLGVEVINPTDVTVLIKGENISGTGDINFHDVDNMRYVSTITVNQIKTISIPRKGELFLNVSNIINTLGDSNPFSFQVILNINNNANYMITPTFDIRNNKIFEGVITDENMYKSIIENNYENGMLAISENIRLYFPKCKYVSLDSPISKVLEIHEQTVLEHNKLAGLNINAPNELDRPRRNFVLVSARNEQIGYMSAGGTMLDTHPTNSSEYFLPGWGMFHEYGHLYDQRWIFSEIWNNLYSKNMAEKTIGFTWLWGKDRQGYENKNIEVFYKDYLLNGSFIERGFGFGQGLYFFISLQEFFGMNFVSDMTGYYRNNDTLLIQQEYIVYVIAKIYKTNAIPYMQMYGYYQYSKEVVDFVIDNSTYTLMFIPNNPSFSKYSTISVPPIVKSIYTGINGTLMGMSNANAKIKVTVNNNIYTTTADSNSKFSIVISEAIDENSIIKISAIESNKTVSVERQIRVKTLLSDNLFSFLGLGDALIATLSFDVTSKTIIVKSTGTGSHGYFKDSVYFSATLYDNNGQSLATSSVTGNENANSFATILNGKSFNYGYYIKLTHAEPSRLSLNGIVTNAPSSSSPFNFKNINLSRVKFYIRNNGIEYNFI